MFKRYGSKRRSFTTSHVKGDGNLHGDIHFSHVTGHGNLDGGIAREKERYEEKFYTETNNTH